MEGWEGSDCAVYIGGQAQTFELTLFSEVLVDYRFCFVLAHTLFFCCIIEATHMHIIKG